MIEKLTKKQEERLSEFRDKWLAIGLSTGPVDFERAKQAAIKCYELAGLKPPEKWDFAPSPMAACRLVNEDSPGDVIYDNAYGSHDAHWLGFFDFFQEVCGIEIPKVAGLIELAQSCGWWIPYDTYCVLQDRPSVITFDDEGRLHNENGKAIEYRDGWGVCAWHGVRVEDYVILNPEKITVQDIKQETNAEVRRVKMFQYGMLRYIQDTGAECIQSDGYGDLYEITTPDGVEKFVKVVNGTMEADGTYKDYILPTWNDVETAHEAVARSYGRAVEEYAPEVRT